MAHPVKILPALCLASIFLVCAAGRQAAAIPGPQQAEDTAAPPYYGGRIYLDESLLSNGRIRGLMAIADSLLEGYRFTAALPVFQYMLASGLLPDKLKTPVYIKMAAALEMEHKNSSAMALYFRALENTEEDTADKSVMLGKASCFVNIGRLEAGTGNRQKAAYYLSRALDIYRRHSPPFEEMVNTLLLMGNYSGTDNRKDYYITGAAILDSVLEKSSGKRRQALITFRNRLYNNIADFYLRADQPDSALLWLGRAEKDFPVSTPPVQTALLITSGEAYRLKGSLAAATESLEQALYLSMKYNYVKLINICHQELGTLYAQAGNYKKAWQHEHEHLLLKEQLFAKKEKQIHALNDIEARYQLAVKDKEITRKELVIAQSQLKTKNFQAAVTVLALVSLGIIIFVTTRYRHKQKLLKEQLSNAEKLRKIAQIEATLKGEENERKRIAKELHDSVVSEVLALKLNLDTMAQSDPDPVRERQYRNVLYQSDTIAGKIRQTAHNLMPVNLRGEGLYKAIEAFLDRISSNNIQFRFRHYGALPPLKDEVEKILLLMVLELIQNIIKHSRASSAVIQFNYFDFDEVLSITVEDNGVGIRPGERGGGMGLSSIEENIRVLQATIDIKSSEYSGTTILIEIPVQEHRLQDSGDEQAVLPEQEADM